jgi:cellulose synthase/poly-beta-1,6-N-acetylglucosamine synthase-like glycosyltransferase
LILSLVFHAISVLILVLYPVILALSARKEEPGPPTLGRVNVIVPTHNEADNIASCLDSLLEMDAAPLPHRIYVLDDGSTDGTTEIVSRYADRVTLIQRQRRTSKADALNHALENLEGEIFAVVDADCVVERSWLVGLVSPLAEDSTGVSTGSILVANRNESVLSRLQSHELAFLCHQLLQPVDRVGMLYSINGNNFAFKRSCWEKVGGFSTSKLTEDTNFAVRTRGAGLGIRFANSRVFTRVPTGIRELLRQRRRWYIGWYQDLSQAKLLGGAIFLLMLYYSTVFFLLSFSVFSILFFIINYAELAWIFRGAYGRLEPLNPLVFMILAPLLVTATILAALPYVLRGKEQLTVDRHW